MSNSSQSIQESLRSQSQNLNLEILGIDQYLADLVRQAETNKIIYEREMEMQKMEQSAADSDDESSSSSSSS